jgi:hypothetical protein
VATVNRYSFTGLSASSFLIFFLRRHIFSPHIMIQQHRMEKLDVVGKAPIGKRPCYVLNMY